MSGFTVQAKDISVKYLLISERANTMQEFLINVIRGRRTYKKEFWALRGVSFDLSAGESLGIIGPNGAGKSTLLKVVSGILEPTTGEVTVNGRIAPMIELSAGFDMALTGMENIYLNASLLGFGRKEIHRKMHRIIEFSELDAFIHSPLKSYSSGMIARLAFSIAIEVEAPILAVDEVLSVGDEGFKKKCHERIEELMRNGVSLLFVSHNMGEVQRVCDRVLWVEQGRIVAGGDPEIISRRYLLHYENNAFEDIREGHPYKEYIDTLFIHGVIGGHTIDGKRYYAPDENVTRAAFAVMLGRALGMPKQFPFKNVFSDVMEEHRASRAIAWLFAQNLIDPIMDDSGSMCFRPNDFVMGKDIRTVLSKVDPQKTNSLLHMHDFDVFTRAEIAKLFCDFFGYDTSDQKKIPRH